MTSVVSAEIGAAHSLAGPERSSGLLSATAAVASGQLARAKVARIPLLFVASFQSIGIMALLRGVVDDHSADAPSVVAGAVILVVGFVGLNLLAQRFGTMRANQALDYYAALPVTPAAVVLGTALSYAAFAIPGAIVTSVIGVAVYGLPAIGVAIAIPAALAGAVPLVGVGAALGLIMPRAELATVAGQLGMTAVLFLGVIPASHLPEVIRGLRLAVPGMLAVDALADSMRQHIDWGDLIVRLALSVAYGVVALGVASVAFRRAIEAS